jgi:hypothetical protein
MPSIERRCSRLASAALPRSFYSMHICFADVVHSATQKSNMKKFKFMVENTDIDIKATVLKIFVAMVCVILVQ